MSSEVPSKRPASAAFPGFTPSAIGNAPAFRRVLQLVDRIGPTDHALLISGPTGAGKEVVAQLAHGRRAHGAAAGAPFVDLNCGALPEHLVESELFGHVKGAFTGANADHPGLFGLAESGTVFLDEIGELPLALQPKLLRVLETRRFRPVGATASRRFDGRVIAATHRNLAELVRQGRFREDLYYRLAVFLLEVPGLDQRKEDIPALVEHFASLQPRALRFSSDALERLREHPWPGHVRQLRNLVDRIAILSDAALVTAEVLDEYLGPASGPAAAPDALFDTLLALNGENKLDAVEQLMIDVALRRSQGNKTAAAQLLGVNRKVVERRVVARDRQRGLLAAAVDEARVLIDAGSLREAIEPLRAALDQTATADAQQVRGLRFEAHRLLAIALRAVNGWLSAEAQAEQEAALRCGEGAVDPGALNSLQFGLWSTQLMTMQLAQARATAQQMLRRAQSMDSPGDAGATAEAHVALANTTFWLADFDEVLASLEQGGLLPPPDAPLCGGQSFDVRGLAVLFGGLAAFQTGAFERAAACRDWLAENGLRDGHAPFSRAIMLQGAAWLAFQFEDTPALGDFAARLEALAIEHEFPFYRGIGQVFRGCYLAAMGDYERGAAEMAQGYEVFMLRHGGKLFHSFQAWQRGKALLAAGMHARAEGLLTSAIDSALEHQDRAYLGELLCQAGLVRLACGDEEAAEDGLRSALSTARALGAVPSRVYAATRLAELLAARGRLSQAADLLAGALAGADPAAPVPILARAQALLRRLQSAVG